MKNKILCVCTDREGRTMEKWVSIDSRTVTFGKTEFIKTVEKTPHFNAGDESGILTGCV